MGQTARGIYRTPGWAHVTDDTIGMDIREADYRSKDYSPEYDKLPTKEAYEAAKKKGDDA